ncbi:MAG: Gmad2 immunoglobulin-like domain-containing protein [Gaiellaceae bacterium]
MTSPLRATGTANTFEANFQYELTDTDGRIIAEDFVTATSGTGTRGTFEFSVPFEVDFGVGSLIVFESSAKDGSRINLVEIPLRMKR